MTEQEAVNIRVDLLKYFVNEGYNVGSAAEQVDQAFRIAAGFDFNEYKNAGRLTRPEPPPRPRIDADTIVSSEDYSRVTMQRNIFCVATIVLFVFLLIAIL